MNTRTKKLLSAVLAAAMLFALAPAAFAESAETRENGYIFKLEDTDGGKVIVDLYYDGADETAYLPKTLAGIELTPENVLRGSSRGRR